MTTFKPGDKVIEYYDHKPRAIRYVVRVTKRFVELSDSRWQLDGSNSYPKSKESWHSKHIAHWTEEAGNTIRRARLIHAVRYNREWDNLETSQLEDIAKIAGLKP